MTAVKKLNQPASLLKRHWTALVFVFSVIVPVIFRTGRRPVIFSRWSGMGDIICTIPATLELKKRHPSATFIYNCHPDFTAVPQIAGITSRVTSLEPIGVVGHWYKFLLAGFYHFAHGDDTPGKVAQEPMVAEFCRQFGLPVTDSHPQFVISAGTQEKVKTLLAQKKLDVQSLVLIHPGPSWTVKEWPRENWTQLVARLRERGFTNIAQLGVGRYSNFGKVVIETIPGAASFVDELSIEECIALIGQAKLFVGIDSGLLHIAASTRTSAIGLWGSTSPQFFYAESVRKNFIVSRVECQGCYHRLPRLHWITNCPHDIRCMKTIEMDEVLDACLTWLEMAAH